MAFKYVQDYERDYQDHKNQVDTAYGLDGSPCAPEGKLTVNPNDCSSFLMCNHKKYMVRISLSKAYGKFFFN